MANELHSLSMLFQNRLFRIPDLSVRICLETRATYEFLGRPIEPP